MVALHRKFGVPLGLGFLAALCTGGMCVVNRPHRDQIGFIVHATLGTMEIWRGMLLFSLTFSGKVPLARYREYLSGTVGGFPLSFLGSFFCSDFWIILDVTVSETGRMLPVAIFRRRLLRVPCRPVRLSTTSS